MRDPERALSHALAKQDAEVEHDFLMRETATGHRDDIPAVEFMLAFLPVFPGEEAVGGPRAVQDRVHGGHIRRARHVTSIETPGSG